MFQKIDPSMLGRCERKHRIELNYNSLGINKKQKFLEEQNLTAVEPSNPQIHKR